MDQKNAGFLYLRHVEIGGLKLKVLVLSDLWVPFPGGAERMMQNISFALKQRGAEVSALTFYRKYAISEGRVPVKGIAVRGDTPHEEQWRILLSEITAAAPDVILTHQLFPDKFRNELAALGIPVVQVVHAAPRWPYVKFAVYNSVYTMMRNENRSPDDMVIIPPASQTSLAWYHGKAIGFIKPVGHKGVDLVNELADVLPHRHFVILRGEWWHFDKLIDRPNVEYLAPVDYMRDFYRRCQLVLVPSLYEDAGTVPQEAALNNLPCISSAVGGLPETNGGLVELDATSVRLWAITIEGLLNDTERYNRVVVQQQERLVSFAWDQKFDELYARMGALCRSKM
jgi:glycosyl transferase family 1/glycosyl transferase family 4